MSFELKDIIKKPGSLNNALEQTHDDGTRNRTLEAREEFQSKYQNQFRKEAEKTTMFRQMNLEKPTKWFLNMASEKNQWTLPLTNQKRIKRSTQTEMISSMMSIKDWLYHRYRIMLLYQGLVQYWYCKILKNELYSILKLYQFFQW